MAVIGNDEIESLVDWSDSKIIFFSKYVENRNVLDIGVVQHDMDKASSSTWLHRALSIKAKNILGIDIDSKGIEHLKNLHFNIEYADAQDFHLDKTFDVITAGDLIEHLDNPGGFLECVKEHLLSTGRLVLSTPNPFWWKTFFHLLLKGNSCPHPEHTCWFCEQTITQLLERHGFYVEKLDYGTVYILSTFYQRLTKIITTILPLPKRFRHNTIMLTAKIKHSHSI